MHLPLVSVIITTYNGNKERLPKCLDSILNQTYKNIEIIIVDDASTNNIAEVIKDYQKKHKNIFYFKNEKNLGVSKSSNKGIKQSKGKYIARIDDDDIRNDKTKIEKQVRFMEENPEYGLCGTGEYSIINENGDIIEEHNMRLSDYDIRQHILQSNQFVHSSIMLRRESLDNVGLYNEQYLAALDYEIICRVGAKYKFSNIEGVSVLYRINTGGITKKKHGLQYKNSLKVFWNNRNNFPNFYRAFILRIGAFILPNNITKFILGKIKKYI